MRELEVDLGAHIVNCADESFRILVEVRGKDEVRNLQIEIVLSINVQILRLQIAVSKAFVLDSLQAIHQLFEVVSSNRLRKSSRFG